MLQREKAAKLGRDNETAVLCCGVTKWLPSWVYEVRQATDEEDHSGVDIVVSTHFGDLPVQVKSSRAGAMKHAHRYPDIPVVTVYAGDDDAEIARKLRKALRERLLRVEGVCPAFWPDERHDPQTWDPTARRKDAGARGRNR